MQDMNPEYYKIKDEVLVEIKNQYGNIDSSLSLILEAIEKTYEKMKVIK